MTRIKAGLRWLFAPRCTPMLVVVAFIVGSVATLHINPWWVGTLIFAGVGAAYGTAAGLAQWLREAGKP